MTGKVVQVLVSEVKETLKIEEEEEEKPTEKRPWEETEDEYDYGDDGGEVEEEGDEEHGEEEEGAGGGEVEAKEEEVGESEEEKVVREALAKAEEGAVVVSEDADKARKEVKNLKSALMDLESSVDDLEKELKGDYGPDNELWPLKGQCYSIKVNQYTYEMCPYKDAKQKEGHSSVSLGKWAGVKWEDGVEGQAGKTFTFEFSGGQKCWNGPERSLIVEAKCGVEESILSVNEPSMCEYHMSFATPTAW